MHQQCLGIGEASLQAESPANPQDSNSYLWDTNARINGLVAVDLETLVSQVLSDYPPNADFANGVFIMTTATDHKNNLNSSALKKNYARTLRVEPFANSAGGTAEVAIVPSQVQDSSTQGLTQMKTPKTA